MDSIEKLDRMLEDLSGPPGPNAEPFELGLRSAAMGLGPMIRGMLPEDPQDLDGLLVVLAREALRLRSDDVEQVTLRGLVSGGEALLPPPLVDAE